MSVGVEERGVQGALARSGSECSSGGLAGEKGLLQQWRSGAPAFVCSQAGTSGQPRARTESLASMFAPFWMSR